MWRWTALVLLLTVQYLTLPNLDDFYAQYAYTSRKVEFFSKGFYNEILVHPSFLRPKERFLGLYQTWIPLDNPCKCQHGLCLTKCICLPSWSGKYCHVPIRGSISLWKGWIYPTLYELFASLKLDTGWLSEWGRTETFFMPLKWYPAPLEAWLVWLDLDQFTVKWTVLELFTLLHLMGFFYQPVCFWPMNWLSTTHQEEQAIPFLLNIFSFYQYAPKVYTLLGDGPFVMYYLLACATSHVGGMQWKNNHQGATGLNLALLILLCLNYPSYRQDVFVFGLGHLLQLDRVNLGECIGATTLAWFACLFLQF